MNFRKAFGRVVEDLEQDRFDVNWLCVEEVCTVSSVVGAPYIMEKDPVLLP
jgi:hypothetical protein